MQEEKYTELDALAAVWSPAGRGALELDHLLAVLRTELDAEVVVADAVNIAPPGCVETRLPNGLARVRRSLRITPRGGRTLDKGDRRIINALASLIAAELEAHDRRQAAWWRSVERIQEVLREGALRIVYQPIADLYSGEVVGVEALSRFSDPAGRGPDRWFREAAAVGLAERLEALALDRAATALPVLPPEVYLSVNLSPAALLSDEVAAVLEHVDGRRIVVEITEHAEVDDYDALNSAIVRLRERGIRVAVDDAGSGFASMRHVLRLSPDIIKLDLSLTQGIDNDSVLRALGFSLRSFATAIDAQVVAEGVETAAEIDALRFLGVAYGQGYYLRRPSPLEEHDWLATARLTPTTTG